jgi:glycosyltransferase involved in cell wall biosynthesis
LLPFLKQKFSLTPVVDFLHCEDPGWYKGGYPYFSSLFTNLLDISFVTSDHLRNWCIANGADGSKIRVCYINIDAKTIKRQPENGVLIRERSGLPENIPVLIYVARLTHQKQPLVLVEVLNELHIRKVDFRCIIIGDGPDRRKMLTRIKEFGLSGKVIYEGMRSNDAVLDYMDAANIFFLPSLYEGIALSIFEAMAKELAIVSADTGGQSELVNEDCGVLIDPADTISSIKNYADTLERLIKDPLKVKAMGSNGKKRVESCFKLEDMSTMMDDTLSSINVGREGKISIDDYLLVTNRMLYLEAEFEKEQKISNSRVVRFLSKHKSIYNKVKKLIGRK